MAYINDNGVMRYVPLNSPNEVSEEEVLTMERLYRIKQKYEAVGFLITFLYLIGFYFFYSNLALSLM